jgi:hypothetical protein
VKPDLDSLATALYVRSDDLLKESPQLASWHPPSGITPKLSDAELVTLAVLQATQISLFGRCLGSHPRSQFGLQIGGSGAFRWAVRPGLAAAPAVGENAACKWGSSPRPPG